MSARLRELTERRRALLAQSEALRECISDRAKGLEQVLNVADVGVAAGRFVAGKPLLVVALGAVLLGLKPRRALRVLSLALGVASVLSQLRQIVARSSSSRR